MMDLRSKLESLNLALPPAPKPVAAYVPFVRVGELVMVSGQLPLKDGQLLAVGRVPSVVNMDQAQACARQCALNALAILDDALQGNWKNFVRIARLTVFVACDAGFVDHPKVANGASELLSQLLGVAGTHARSAVGVSALPLGAAVELEMTAQVR